jgi:hypothetical protein
MIILLKLNKSVCQDVNFYLAGSQSPRHSGGLWPKDYRTIKTYGHGPLGETVTVPKIVRQLRRH